MCLWQYQLVISCWLKNYWHLRLLVDGRLTFTCMYVGDHWRVWHYCHTCWCHRHIICSDRFYYVAMVKGIILVLLVAIVLTKFVKFTFGGEALRCTVELQVTVRGWIKMQCDAHTLYVTI